MVRGTGRINSLLSVPATVALVVVVASQLPNPALGQWTQCDNENSIKGGSCNDPNGPCEPGSGCTNAGKTNDIYGCESLCEKAPNCTALTWHDQSVAGWANVCVLQEEAAWHLSGQRHHHAACLKSSSFPDCNCGKAPAPSPGPHSNTDACLVAKTAFAKANQALGGRGNAAVFASLDAWMGLSKCPNTTAPATKTILGESKVRQSALTAIANHYWYQASSSFFVSPTTGSDTNPGTSEDKPFKTLARAQTAVRLLSATQRAGAQVNLLEGTHYLSESLVFTEADSGAPSHPVVWQAYPASAAVTVSGGAALDCDWTPMQADGNTILKCTLPEPMSFDSLFIDGLRQVSECGGCGGLRAPVWVLPGSFFPFDGLPSTFPFHSCVVFSYCNTIVVLAGWLVWYCNICYCNINRCAPDTRTATHSFHTAGVSFCLSVRI